MPKLTQTFLVSLLCLATAGCFWETMDASYDTAAEVIDGGYLDKGWIPTWLPRKATDIREVHEIDSNVSELSFAIPGISSVKLPDECRVVEYGDTVQAYIRRRWWPEEKELQRSYVFYTCPADATDYTFVAIRKAGDRVLHWRTYGR